MNFKHIIAALALTLAGTAQAQDRIFQTDGNVLRVRIVTVNSDNVVYRDWKNEAATEHTMDKNKVDKIKYENGKVEWFSHYARSNRNNNETTVVQNEEETEQQSSNCCMNKLGGSILALAPIHVTDRGFGFSVNYEHAIDKNGLVSYTLPFSGVFDNANQYYGYGSNYNQYYTNYMFSFSPGLKIYPTTRFGKVKYAVGPSLMIGAGKEYSDANVYPLYYNYYAPTEQNALVLGAMLVNYLNISPNNHIYLGADLGFGFTYLNRLGDQNRGMSGLSQLSFKIGYRF